MVLLVGVRVLVALCTVASSSRLPPDLDREL